jgi:hypothetical protein
MNSIATYVVRFMEAHPHPALRLNELMPSVADAVDRSITVERLRETLAEYPHTFRILDPWQGPWRVADAAAATTGDAWVVLLNHPSPSTATPRGAVRTLRESVRWLAREVDERSALSVSRWYAMALSERESRKALASRAAA